MLLSHAPVPLRLAARELRSGTRGFRIFLTCLTLGVGAIASVQSVSHGLLQALREDGRSILGGDLALRLTYYSAESDVLALLERYGVVSTAAELRAMARSAAGESGLVEVKAVDGAYPLVGAVDLREGQELTPVIARVEGRYGAAVEPRTMEKLDAVVGDRIMVGDAEFEIRAVIEREPDRLGTGGIALGPRVLISLDALDETGLRQPGSLIYWHHRLALAPGQSEAEVLSDLETAFPDAPWRVRGIEEAAPQLSRFITRLALFLTLVGLTALLVGGVGVANAVDGFVESRLHTIATLRCLGAPTRTVFQVYFAQILALAAVGIGLGLFVGALVPWIAGAALDDLLPVQLRVAVDPPGLLVAAGYGLLTTLAFSLWPMGKAELASPTALFRSRTAPLTGVPAWSYQVAAIVAAAGLAGLAILTADKQSLAIWFLIGAVASFALFRGTGWLVTLLVPRLGRPLDPRLRLAVGNLHRPGNPTGSTVLSLGLGLSVLVAVSLIESNFNRQVREQIPQQAPAFFFIDIQPAQLAPFTAAVEAVPGAGMVKSVPALRGRIARINGQPAQSALVSQEYAWILRGDRGVTYSASVPEGSRVVAGDWWPSDYQGPPQLSIYKSVAEAFGLEIGDEMGINILGRTITAEVASIRDMNFSNINLNFTLVFSPGVLEAAPSTHIATVDAPPEAESAIEAASVRSFPNVSAIRVRETLATVAALLEDIGFAVRATAAVAIVAGILVLAGALAAGHERRRYDDVILKMLGATRRDLVVAHATEFGLLGLVTALLASLIGSTIAFFVVTEVMGWSWSFDHIVVVSTLLTTVVVTIGVGLVASYWSLSRSAAALLRNE